METSISSFQGRPNSYKKFKMQLPVLLFPVFFTSAFTSAGIFFYKFLEFYSTLSEKIFSSQILLFHRFTQIPAPPYAKTY